MSVRFEFRVSAFYRPPQDNDEESDGNLAFELKPFTYFNYQIQPQDIEDRAAFWTTHQIQSYERLHTALCNVFTDFDHATEIAPSPDEINTWEGRITIYTRLRAADAEKIVEAVLNLGLFTPSPPLQHSWAVRTLANEKPYNRLHRIQVLGCRANSLEFNTPVTLPVYIEPEKEQCLSKRPSPNGPKISFVALELLAQQQNQQGFNKKAAQQLIEKFSSAGQMTEELASCLNQADWYHIFRSLGPVSTTAGVLAWGLGGPLGVALEQTGTILSAVGGAATAYDYQETIYSTLRLVWESLPTPRLPNLRLSAPCDAQVSYIEQIDSDEEDGWIILSTAQDNSM